MGERRFLGIQTVISEKTHFLRTVWGAALGLMQLKILSVKFFPAVQAGGVAILKA